MGIPPLPASLPRRFFALITTLFLSFFPVGLAGLPAVLDGHPAEAYAGEPSAHGFLQGNYSLNTAAQNPDGKDFKWAEVRGQIKLDAPGETLRLFIKTDISYDHIDGDGGGELREGYLDVTGKNWDVRLGRQIITWGLGDLIFINDVFPKDYEAFFSGRPMEYLKKGVDGVKAGLYPAFASFEIVVIPFFEPNNFPARERFWMFDPMPTVSNRPEEEPRANLRDTEIAIRAYRDIAGIDASFYAYKGFYRTSSMLPDAPSTIKFFYPRLSVYGISLQASAASGVLSLESGYYDSREDGGGRNPFVPNSQIKFLMGYQRQIIEDLTAGLQYSGEYMRDYSEYRKGLPAGVPKDPEFRQLASLRLTYFLMHQDMRLSWFSFWSPTDRDYLVNPEVKYNFSDHVWGAIGANVFGGRSGATQFGSLSRNDNIYVQARYEF